MNSKSLGSIGVTAGSDEEFQVSASGLIIRKRPYTLTLTPTKPPAAKIDIGTNTA
ncbi:MAG TPA: hypothetical protein VK775_13950 [Chthoniobacterales bacterium]|jgi:hypothetical protein|nr:hypothetical protein [Chthoniobacterales bacterium]